MRAVPVSSFIKNSSYWSERAGIRWQLLLSILVFWAVSAWLQQEYGQDDSNLWLVMKENYSRYYGNKSKASISESGNRSGVI